MSDTKSPADAIAPALRDEAELRELIRLYNKWWLKDIRRLRDVVDAVEQHMTCEDYRGLP